MATLPLIPSSSPAFSLTKKPLTTNLTPINLNYNYPKRRRSSLLSTKVKVAYRVVIEHEGKSTEMEVEEDESILTKALDIGLDLPHDCKLGVCMTCPAKLVTGKVDQSEGMLSDDVIDSGYALLCASYPRSDCYIKMIPEEELLSLQLATAND